MELHGFYRKIKDLYPNSSFDSDENVITVNRINGSDVDDLIVEVDSITFGQYDGTIRHCEFAVVDEFSYVQIIPVLEKAFQ